MPVSVHSLLSQYKYIAMLLSGWIFPSLPLSAAEGAGFSGFALPLLCFICLLIGVGLGRISMIRRHQHLANKIIEEQVEPLRLQNARLEESVNDLRQLKDEQVQSAHRAGMAEIAADVLHNIGNALNTVHVSANLIEKYLQSFRLDFLRRIVSLLEENQEDLPAFFSKDNKGKMVVDALEQLVTKMEEQQKTTMNETKHLHEQIFHINEIVVAQRRYALADNVFDEIDLREMVEDVFRIQESAIEEYQIRIMRQFDPIPLVKGSKVKLLHIFNHIVKNAVEALTMVQNRQNRFLIVRLRDQGERIRMEVQDNGIGIRKEDLTRIFHHGFSLKRHGHGNGLHNCANSLSDMGGNIGVKSSGLGQGAIFVLEIPKIPREGNSEASNYELDITSSLQL